MHNLHTRDDEMPKDCVEVGVPHFEGLEVREIDDFMRGAVAKGRVGRNDVDSHQSSCTAKHVEKRLDGQPWGAIPQIELSELG